MQKQTIMRFVLVLVVAALTSTGLFVAAQGDRTNYGNTAQGEIAAAGETASWYFDGVSGDVITVEVARTGGNLIPAVSLAGPDNELIISLEWPEQGPPVVKFTTSLRVSGEHTVTISGHADTTGTYALTLELQEAGQPTTGNTGMLAYGRTVSGTITDTVFREFWSFRGTQGDVIDVLMTATSGDLDTFLTLSTPNGTLLIETNTGGAGQDAALYAVTLPVSGTYSITARRAGSNYGETGSSQGNYDLLLSLRRAGTDTGQPVPAGLALGTEMRGRLTADAPSAMYEVEAGGILSLGLDLLDPLHISTLTVMTPQRALLGTFLGIAPLRVSVAASGQSTVWIEIASAGLQENAPLDFALQVDRLNTATNASEPLLYGQSREIHEVVTHWHFAGQAGDQVEFALKPFGPAQGGLIQMFAPDGSQIVQRAVQTDLAQPLGLVANGIYEIVIDPVTAAGGYEIGVRRTGMAKRAFEQHSLPDDLGILEGGIAHTVSRELAPGESHIWSLDVTDSQVWMFQAEQVNGSAPLALVILSPGGHWMETATSDQLTNIASIQVKLPHAGRYQLLVFDPTGQTANAYTLWGAPVEGNLLALNTPAKGVLTSSQPRDVWQLRGVANTFLSLDVIVLRGAVPPSIHVIGPDNQEIIPVTTLKTVGIPLVESGLYTLIVEGLPTTYTIAADIAVPFAEDAGMRLTTNPLDSAVPELFVVDTAAPSPTQRVVLTDLITPHILPGDQAMGSASSLETNTLIRGEIAPDQLYQVWSLDAVASQMWSISVMPFGNGSIPDITLLDRAGRVIAEQLRPEGSTAHLTYRFSTGGLHYVVIRSINGGRYLLWAETFSGINERLPDVLPGEVIAYGDTQSGVLHQPEETAYFVFYGHTGDIIRVSAAITQGDWPLTLKLLDTTGGVLAESDGLLENIRIPGDGIYRLAVQHTGTRSSPGGVFALHLNLEQAANTTTYSGGILTNGRIAQLGANSAQHHWLFDASAGEQVTIRVEPLAPGAPTSLRLQLADTGGNVFLQQETNLGQGALQVANVLLPRAGVYQAIMSGGQRQAGLYRISFERDIRRIQDHETSLSYGTTQSKVLTRENFLDVWTFAGSNGDRISILARAIRGDAALVSVQLRTGNGQVLATVADDGNGNGVRLEGIVLPQDGHYSIIVGNPDGTFDGETAYEITVRLENTPAHSAGTVIDLGQTVESAFWINDPVDIWLVDALQGDVLSAAISSSNPALMPSLSLVSTDWHVASQTGQAEVLASVQALEGEPAQLKITLPRTGSYALVVEDPTRTGGRYQLGIDRQTTATSETSMLPPGLTQEGELSPLYAQQMWAFEGTVGAAVTVLVTPDRRSILPPIVTLIAPDGTPVAQSETAAIYDYRLPTSGQYTLNVTGTAGRYAIDLSQTPPLSLDSSPLAYDGIETGILDDGIPIQHWFFEGQFGDVVHIHAESTSGDLDPVIRIYDDERMLLLAEDDAQGLNADVYFVVPSDASYRVDVSRYGETYGQTSGNYTLSIALVYHLGIAPQGQPLAFGDRVAGTTSNESRSDLWWFAGERGDTVQVKIQFPIDDAPLQLFLRDPEGNTLVAGERDRGDSLIEAFTLPANGPYVLEVRRPGDARAVYTPYTLDLTLTSTVSDVVRQGGILAIGQTATAHFADSVTPHIWLFEGQAGEQVALVLTRLSGTFDTNLILTSPDGRHLFVTDTVSGTSNSFSTGVLDLPLDGLYTLLITSQSPSLVYRLELTGNPTPDGEAIRPLADAAGTINALQPSQQWYFEAGTGQMLSLRVRTSSGDLEPTLTLWGPDGFPLLEGVQAGSQASITGFAAPQDGRYTVTVGRKSGLAGSTSGSYRLVLYTYPVSERAVNAEGVAFGETVAGFLGTPAPHLYAFRGLAGDVVGLSVQVTVGETIPYVTLETEDGIVLNLPVMTSDNEVGVTALALPENARYVVAIQSDEALAYALTVIRRDPSVENAALVRALPRNQVSAEGITDPAQPVHWTFSGSAGDVVNFTVDTSGGGLRADATLYGPHGYVTNAVEQAESQVTIFGPVRLPDDGNYVLVIGSWLGTSAGRFTVRMDAAEPGVSGSDGGHIPVHGLVVTGGLIPEDNQDIWTFNGQAGEVVTIRAEQTGGNGSLRMELNGPDDTLVGTGQTSTIYLGSEISSVILPDTGEYHLVVNGQLASASRVEYRLIVAEQQSPLIASLTTAHGLAYGETASGTITPGETYQAWTFFGQPGERIRSVVDLLNTQDDLTLHLISPTGRVLAMISEHDGMAQLPEIVLPDTGFYGLVVHTTNSDGAEYTIQLEQLAAGAIYQGTLHHNATGMLTLAAPVHEWSFDPAFTGDYTLQITGLAPGFQPDLFVKDTNGNVIGQGLLSEQGVVQAHVRLGAAQIYSAVISGGMTVSQGHYWVELMPSSVFLNGGQIAGGEENVGQITNNHLTDEWLISGTPGDTLEIEAERTSGSLLLAVSVFDLNGVLIAEAVAAGGDDIVQVTARVLEMGQLRVIVSRVDDAAGRTQGDYTIRVNIVE